MIVAELLKTYRDSHFKARDYVPAERIASPLEQAKALKEYLADPLASLKANVEQARLDVEQTAERMETAKYDGILDRDVYRTATKEEKEEWRRIVKMLKGDHQRALSELDHWRGYVRDAIDGTLAMPKGAALPQPQTYEDPRLPPERDEEVPF